MKIALATVWQAGAPKPTAFGAKVLGIKATENLKQNLLLFRHLMLKYKLIKLVKKLLIRA
jgi:hypothetical protein